MGSTTQPDSGTAELLQRREQIDALVERIHTSLRNRKWPQPCEFAVRLALEEAISNAFRHGHRGLPKDAPIHIAYSIGDDDLTITIADQGPGFDPDAVPDPTLDENLERPSGRGIMLMRAYMTRVEFEPPGNKVTLYYSCPRSELEGASDAGN